VHYQSGVSRDELARLGMIDTKDLLVRGRLCASCHVGSADRDMDHDMIAAGHPPLRFEQASYEALLGRKHWDDRPSRAANPNYEVQLWGAGRVTSAEASLDLLEGRAHRAMLATKALNGPGQATNGGQKQPWPEFAELNCLACHQPLRAAPTAGPVMKLFEKSGWTKWNTALLGVACDSVNANRGQVLPLAGVWQAIERKLRVAMEEELAPEPEKVAALASEARSVLRQHELSCFQELSATDLLENLLVLDEGANWEELCQQVAALAAARRSLSDQGKLFGIGAGRFQERLSRIAAALRFKNVDREWPVVYADPDSRTRTELWQELVQLQRDLLSEVRP
jgi:hypothetical protein